MFTHSQWLWEPIATPLTMHGMHHEGEYSGQEELSNTAGHGQDQVGQERGEEGNEESCSGSKEVAKPAKQRPAHEHAHGEQGLHVAEDDRVGSQFLGEELEQRDGVKVCEGKCVRVT